MTEILVDDLPARPVVLDPGKIAIAMSAFFRLADAWQLSADEARTLLGQPARATFFQWKAGQVGRVPYDTIRRISWLLGIWKALQILFPVAERADAWVRRQNSLLGGQSALQRMLAGDVTDLAEVRSMLDYARGGGV
ncbi:MAG: MbcA/ParS/Xre antitoxin family protein [Planctomycetota bacterium]